MGQLLQPLPLLRPLVPEQGLLHGGLVLGNQVDGGDGQGPHRLLHVPAPVGQLHGLPGDLPAQTSGDLQPLLAADVTKIRVPDLEGHPGALHAVPPQAGPHLIGQLNDPRLNLLPALQIVGKGVAVAHRLGGRVLSRRGHRGAVQAAGVVVELAPLLSQQAEQPLPVKPGQVPDGAHPHPLQGLRRRPAHVQQVGHRQGPHQPLVIVPADPGGGVRLFIVAAQLGKNLVEGDAHRDGQTELLAHPAADLVGQGHRVPPEQVEGARHVQPALVDAEGLHQIGVVLVHTVDLLGKLPVHAVVGGKEHQVGTLPLGLPDGLRRLDLKFFGRLVFGQDDAVAALRVAAHRHRQMAQLRVVQKLHRCVKAVQIAVKNDPLHARALLSVSVYGAFAEKSNRCSKSR